MPTMKRDATSRLLLKSGVAAPAGLSPKRRADATPLSIVFPSPWVPSLLGDLECGGPRRFGFLVFALARFHAKKRFKAAEPAALQRNGLMHCDASGAAR